MSAENPFAFCVFNKYGLSEQCKESKEKRKRQNKNRKNRKKYHSKTKNNKLMNFDLDCSYLGRLSFSDNEQQSITFNTKYNRNSIDSYSIPPQFIEPIYSSSVNKPTKSIQSVKKPKKINERERQFITIFDTKEIKRKSSINTMELLNKLNKIQSHNTKSITNNNKNINVEKVHRSVMIDGNKKNKQILQESDFNNTINIINNNNNQNAMILESAVINDNIIDYKIPTSKTNEITPKITQQSVDINDENKKDSILLKRKKMNKITPIPLILSKKILPKLK
jgi:hypothetical protein